MERAFPRCGWAIFGGCWALASGAAGAATHFVTTPEDSGPGSFRQAIVDMNAAGEGLILFSNLSQGVQVAQPLPSITAKVIIIGPGTNFPTFSSSPTLQVDAPGKVRLRSMSWPTLAVSNQGSLTIVGSRIGNCVLRNNGTMTVSQSSPYNGAATLRVGGTGSVSVTGLRLGGVNLDAGSLALMDCIIAGQTRYGTNAVGHCVEDPLAPPYYQRCWIAPYASAARGGGVFMAQGHLGMTRCTITDNHVRGGHGTVVGPGGIAVLDAPGSGLGGGLYMASGTLGMTNCSVVNNSGEGGRGGYTTRNSGAGGASGMGGIVVAGGTGVLVNCTIARNSGTGGEGGEVAGGSAVGGLAVYGGEVSLVNCTVAENTASAGRVGPGLGMPPYLGVKGIGIGGISISSFGRLRMINSIVAGNLGSISANGAPVLVANDGVGNLVSLGHNFLGTTNPLVLPNQTNFLTGTTASDRINPDPRLGPWLDSASMTSLYIPLPGSPLIDAGTNVGVAVDQRGRPRTCDGRQAPNTNDSDGTDIGAVEADQSMCFQVVTQAGNDIRISFTTGAGIRYGLQYKADLEAPAWNPLPGLVTGTGDLVTYTNAGARSESHRFYRVFEQGP